MIIRWCSVWYGINYGGGLLNNIVITMMMMCVYVYIAVRRPRILLLYYFICLDSVQRFFDEPQLLLSVDTFTILQFLSFV